MLKTNQIYKDLIELIKVALKSQGLNWQVIQTYQQSMGNLQPPYVMLHRLTATNFGFQYGKDISDKHTENQIEILKFQIEACKPRNIRDKVETITATDAVRLVAMYFMSDEGIQAVRNKGYNVLRITEVYEEYYKAVSDIYQVNPHFKMDLVVLNSIESSANKIGGIVSTIKKI